MWPRVYPMQYDHNQKLRGITVLCFSVCNRGMSTKGLTFTPIHTHYLLGILIIRPCHRGYGFAIGAIWKGVGAYLGDVAGQVRLTAISF